eukprot:TRINITY_DN4220_c0_g3_i1.p1 TRINITY_DN4220_c0_g3~~TRINITY_DN4220_c0_g3_i1.p1  ORF type:complete len:1305 (+),score=313.85 TRINITY_DN4220_c0_g3_i1:81-3995(+)
MPLSAPPPEGVEPVPLPDAREPGFPDAAEEQQHCSGLSAAQPAPAAAAGCTVPVWLTLTCVAVLAAVVSMGGGLYLYFRSKDSIERRVSEIANAELRRFSGLLRESFIVTEERAWELVSWTQSMSKHVDSWRNFNDIVNSETLAATLSRNRSYGRNSGSGVAAWPLATGLADAPANELMTAYVWWDPLRTGQTWFVQGLPETVGGQLLVPYWTVDDPEHQVWDETAEPQDRLELVGAYAECLTAPGQAFWNEPASWLKVDNDVALYVHYTVVFTFPALSTSAYGTMIGCADAETDLVHWDPMLALTREASSGRLFVAELVHGVVLAHTHEPRPAPSAQCKLDEVHGNTSGRIHGCFPRIADYSPAVQHAARAAQGAVYDRVFLSGGVYVSKHSIWVLPHAGGGDYSVDAVWYRDSGPIQDEIDKSLFAMVGFVIGAVVVNVALSVAQMFIIARPIGSLARSVELLGNMDIEAAEEHHRASQGTAVLRATELVRLSAGFEKACLFLRQWRSFVPESMRAGDPAEREDSDRDQQATADGDVPVLAATSGGEGSPHLTLLPIQQTFSVHDLRGPSGSELSGSFAGSAAAGGAERAMQRLTDRTLRCRSGTVVQVDFALAEFYQSGQLGELQPRATRFVLQELPGALSAVQGSGGITHLLSADLLLATWHTHKPCPDHSYAAAQCAVRVSAAESASGCATGCARGSVLVGHAGTADSRHPVLLGEPLWQADALSRLCPTLDAPVLVTHPVCVATAGRLRACVVDVVASAAGRAVKVYELLPAGSVGAEEAAAYLEGFSSLCKMDLERCCAQLTRLLQQAPGDRHAVRLLRIALGLRATGDQRTAYCRKAQPHLEPLELLGAGVPLPGELDDTVTRARWAELNAPGRGGLATEARLAALRAVYRRLSSSAEVVQLRLDIEKELGTTLANPLASLPNPTSVSARRTLPDTGSSSTSSGARRRPLRPVRARSASASSRSSSTGGRPPLRGARAAVASSGSDSAGSCPSLGASGEGDPELPAAFATQSGGTVKRWTRSGKLLGRGAFGEVWMGMGEDGGLVALKVLPLKQTGTVQRRLGSGSSTESGGFESLIQEVSLMVHIRHENVVSYLGSCVVPGHIVIVMEYLSGGSLQGLLEQFGRFNGQVAALRRYLVDISCGLGFLHNKGIVHRDLKPHNVLLAIEGQCKLADFGTSGKVSEIAARAKRGMAIAGTPLYMSPEAARGDLGKPTDVWALGVMICQLWTGQVPYETESGFNLTFFLRRLAKDAAFGPKLPEDMPADLESMARSCLERDPALRPSAVDIQNHPFLLSQ